MFTLLTSVDQGRRAGIGAGQCRGHTVEEPTSGNLGLAVLIGLLGWPLPRCLLLDLLRQVTRLEPSENRLTDLAVGGDYPYRLEHKFGLRMPRGEEQHGESSGDGDGMHGVSVFH